MRMRLRHRLLLLNAAAASTALPDTITATWDGEAGDFTPDWAFDFTDLDVQPQVGDVIELRRSTASDMSGYTSASHTIVSISPLDTFLFDFGGDWTPDPQTWYVQFFHQRSGSYIGRSEIGSFLLTSADVTAPVLSSIGASSITATTATGEVTTDEANGTLYYVVTTSATAPSKAQVKAGQDHAGAAATASGNQAIASSGAKTASITGLTAETSYYLYWMHEDAATNQSSIPAGANFTTAASYTASAVTFDGTNDYLTRGAALTGGVNSKLMTLSFWFKSAANGGTRRFITAGQTAGGAESNKPLALKGSTNNEFRIQHANSGGATILDIQSSNSALTVAAGWVHVLLSVDMADTAKRHLYINGVSDLATVTTYTNAALDFTNADQGIMAVPNGTSKMSGDVADFWWAPGQYIDLSVQANREKFRSAAGKPVSLGSDGSTPTGTAPLVFFSGDSSSFATNLGSGGAFTLTGALTDATTSPSD